MRRTTPAAALLVAGLAGGCASGAEFTVYSENDVYAVSNRDRYYTNGLRLSGMYAADDAPTIVGRVAAALPRLSPNATTQIGWVAGQDMYTPANTQLDPPDPDDRPYGGWLYLGVLVSKAVRREDGPAGDNVDVVELDLGVAGPPSLADQTQISYHHLIGSARPRGWDHQIDYEPGIVGQYEHRRRLLAGELPLLGGDWDAIGVGGVSLGNVFTHATAGGVVRWGNGLRRDFGPNTIHSTAVDVPDIEATQGLRTYVFGGFEGRAVARNLFLDGSTFGDSASVERNNYVGELRGGLAVELGSFRLGYTHVLRTREFDSQRDKHGYGSVSLTWSFDF